MQGKWLCARYIVLLFCLAAIICSCSNTKHLAPGQHLLKSNTVDVKSSANLKKIRKNIEQNLSLQGKLALLARQQPNTRTLGIGLKLRLWNLFYSEKGKHFLQTNLGEAPVVFDTTTLPASARLMSAYLVSKGYLIPEVTYSYHISNNNKARVKYVVETGPLYTIDSIYFPVDSAKLNLVVEASSFNTILKKGDAFDSDELSKEQLRIHREFLTTGYFYFRKDFIYFEADTSIGNNKVNVYVKVETVDTSVEQQQYQVRTIYLYPDFNPRYELDTVDYDTIVHEGFHFLTTQHYVDPEVLATAVYMVQGALFSSSSYNCTLDRFYDLGIFKFANARFVDVGANQLDCYIYLQPSKRHSLGAELDVGNEADNFASGVKISYQSRNVFRRANTINFSFVTGVQIPVFPGFRYDSIFYNLSGQIDYILPKFAFPFLRANVFCFNDPTTRISFRASYFQQTNYYSLQNYGITYSMEWKGLEFPLKRYIFPILAINYVFPTYSDSFAKRLSTDPFLAESFSKQFIPSVGGAYIYTNQILDRSSSFTYFRGDAETAGNLLYLAISGLHTPLGIVSDSSGSYSVFRVNFAQYARLELDLRRYLQFTQNRTLVLRFSPGIAVPYGNATAVPYVKLFFLGGTNSMRAWRVRSLGPGTYRDTSNFFNSAGDLKLEANIEYRFSIFGRLKGATFIDAGNIWLLRNDPRKPGGTFYFNQFIDQIAIGTGIGLRLDFTFFVLRLDVATPVYDPSLEISERWAIKNFQLSPNGKLFDDLFFQLAVGYPF